MDLASGQFGAVQILVSLDSISSVPDEMRSQVVVSKIGEPTFTKVLFEYHETL